MIRRRPLPHEQDGVVLTYTGYETDLIFGHGIDLPGFASFPLLNSQSGRALLRSYCEKLIALGSRAGCGVILESATWVANRERAGEIGFAPSDLAAINQNAIELLKDARATFGDVPTWISANVGPRYDAYGESCQMTAREAEIFHSEQLVALAETGLDFVTAYTLSDPIEAIGLLRAAEKLELTMVISFTVEQDGCLASGMDLASAIKQVDAATDHYASYFMINCAHPDHFKGALDHPVCRTRVQGLVANASRCSHAELDAAQVLDDGDPEEFGAQLAGLSNTFTQIRVIGGCCGTDMRHLSRIFELDQSA